jgi:single-stranded-DNA-specific exonuclease
MTRGLTTPEQIAHYLHPKLDLITDPFKLLGVPLAIDAVLKALTENPTAPIVIFADYDVDGTCSAALLSLFFEALKIPHLCVQPDRFKHGYGLKPFATEICLANQSKLLISADCGTTSTEVSNLCAHMGIQLIVLDHHQPQQESPLHPATILINPHQPGCPSQLFELCACGVVFYFLRALRSHLNQIGSCRINLKQHLDLVTLATACDMVPLIKDNHILVRFGLEVLKNTQKPGLQALLKIFDLTSRRFSPSSLGFQLGPVINAAGRMENANLALTLLTTPLASTAQLLANQLFQINQQRTLVQNAVWDEAKGQAINGLAVGKFAHSVCVGSPLWHEGVIGIVASRVAEHFKKPSCVASFKEGIVRASFRSAHQKNILQALQLTAPLLISFGGHHHAAGCSMLESNWEAFSEGFDQALSLQTTAALPKLWEKAVATSISEISFQALLEIEAMGPFGIGNPDPLLSIRAIIQKPRILKDRHLKFELSELSNEGTQKTDYRMQGIWFNGYESHPEIASQEMRPPQRLLVVPELNRFSGQTIPTLRVKEMLIS